MDTIAALLGEIVDYAGLFPPARLDMRPTVANYARYRAGPNAWMLGRVIIPVARLDEFEAAAADHLPRDETELDFPWLISALTAPAGEAGLADDLDRIARFNDQHAEAAAGSALIDTIELRASSVASIDAALDLVPDHIMPFFEVAVASDPRGLVAALAGVDACAKVRTGGVTPELYPAASDLARFIVSCAAARIPFKATAGLHHPLGRRNEAVGANEFGFFNVFIGAALAWAADLAADEVERVLTDDAPDAFAFADDVITWRDHRLDAATIHAARERFCRSFGSCSFMEPIDDLVSLQLLNTTETA